MQLHAVRRRAREFRRRDAGDGEGHHEASFPRFLDEFEKLLTGNEVLLARTQKVGTLPKELAINASISGPMARASGVEYDIRKVDKYGVYGRFEFRVPLGDVGDVYDRYYVRVLEMRESIKILEQALRDIPQGPHIAPEVKLRNFKIPAGDGYGRIEGAEGRTRFLSRLRRRRQDALPVSRASAELH